MSKKPLFVIVLLMFAPIMVSSADDFPEDLEILDFWDRKPQFGHESFAEMRFYEKTENFEQRGRAVYNMWQVLSSKYGWVRVYLLPYPDERLTNSGSFIARAECRNNTCNITAYDGEVTLTDIDVEILWWMLREDFQITDTHGLKYTDEQRLKRAIADELGITVKQSGLPSAKWIGYSKRWQP